MAADSAMIALLSPAVAPCPAIPRESGQTAGALRSDQLLQAFAAKYKGGLAVHLGNNASMGFKASNFKNRHFASFDDVFCMFVGTLQNLSSLRQTYGLSRHHVSEAALVIEMYKALRDRAPFPVNQAVAQLRGAFSFVLYDCKNNTVFVASDEHACIPLYWGACADGVVAIADDLSVLRTGCTGAFAPFPAGCYFSTASGLNSFAHPDNALVAIPHVDSQTGIVCGSSFVVDPHCQVDTKCVHVGSFHDLPAL